LQDPILKIPSQKRAGGVVQGVGPKFKPQKKKVRLISTNKQGTVAHVPVICDPSYMGGHR
jgi:hypothetical protein